MLTPAGRGRPLILQVSCLVATLVLSGCAAHNAGPSPGSSLNQDAYFPNRADRRVIQRPVYTPRRSGPRRPGPPAFQSSEAPDLAPGVPLYASAYKNPGAGPSYQPKCHLGDRFDRGEELAYNFSDGQSRLALDLSIDGFSLGDMGEFEFREIMVRYRYKFRRDKSGKEHCRYNSSIQGLIGSAYNELIVREDETVWEELEDRGVYFWRD